MVDKVKYCGNNNKREGVKARDEIEKGEGVNRSIYKEESKYEAKVSVMEKVEKVSKIEEKLKELRI